MMILESKNISYEVIDIQNPVKNLTRSSCSKTVNPKEIKSIHFLHKFLMKRNTVG